MIQFYFHLFVQHALCAYFLKNNLISLLLFILYFFTCTGHLRHSEEYCLLKEASYSSFWGFCSSVHILRFIYSKYWTLWKYILSMWAFSTVASVTKLHYTEVPNLSSEQLNETLDFTFILCWSNVILTLSAF